MFDYFAQDPSLKRNLQVTESPKVMNHRMSRLLTLRSIVSARARRRIAFAVAGVGALAAAAAGWAQWPTLSQAVFAALAVICVMVGLKVTADPIRNSSSLKDLEAPPGHIPPLTPRLLPQPTAMLKLRELLNQEGRAALIGMGGVGKTQLAVAYVNENAKDFDFIWRLRSRHREVLSADYEAIGSALGLELHGRDLKVSIQAWLANNSRWLLIFDDVTDAAHVQDFLPTRQTGKIILTSRNKLDLPVNIIELQDWTPEDAVAFLQAHVQESTESLAVIAKRLSCVPLALDQAVSYMRATAIDGSTYIRLLEQNFAELMASGRAFSRDDCVATTWSMSIDLAESEGEGARDLLVLCSFYAGSAIPRHLPVRTVEKKDVAIKLPRHFRALISNEMSYNKMLAALSRQSLLTMDGTNLYVHSLVQKVVRAGMSDKRRQRWTCYAAGSLWSLLRESTTQDVSEEQIRLAELLLPHVLSVAEQAKENVPNEWAYRYNFPSWTAIRESARALEAIAFSLKEAADKTTGESAALLALELSIDAFPYLLSFQTRDNDSLAFANLYGCCEAISYYATVTKNTERAESALRNALSVFPKYPPRRPPPVGRAYAIFRYSVATRINILFLLLRVLKVANKAEEARSLIGSVLSDLAEFKYLDPNGSLGAIAHAALDDFNKLPRKRRSLSETQMPAGE